MKALRRTLLVLAWLAAAAPARPGQDTTTVHVASPYTDFSEGMSLALFGGYFGGNRGQAGVGPQGSPIVGLNFGYHLGGPAALMGRLSYAASQRNVIQLNPSAPNTVTGPISAPLILFDADFQFDVTGEKTWHRLAPTLGLGLGLAFGDANPDAGGYRFGSKVYFAFGGGVKYAVGGPWFLRVDLWDYLWQLSYPSTYFTTGVPTVLGVGAPDKEWTSNGVFTIGIAYSLRH